MAEFSLEEIQNAVKQGILDGFSEAPGGDGGGGFAPPGASVITQDDVDRAEEYLTRIYAMEQTEKTRLQAQEQEVRVAKMTLALKQEAGTATEEELDLLREQIRLAEKELAVLKSSNATRDAAIKKIKGMNDSIAGSMSVYKTHPLFNVKKIAAIGKTFKEAGAKGVVPFLGALAGGIITGFINNVIGLIFEIDGMRTAFQRATGANREFGNEVAKSYTRTREFTASIKETSAAWEGLYSGMSTFTMISADARSEIGDTVTLLSKYGVAVGDAAKGMELATKVMGQGPREAAATMRELTATAIDLGVPPKQLAADYAKFGGSLAKLGRDGEKAFKDLARVSKITGLEMGKLLQMTDKFDTFEGAASQAGKLNAALGGNFVNAMDLMTATDPVERFEMIRGALENAGLSFDDMSYYQRKFYADSLGLGDVSELAMMMSGDMNNLGGEIGKTSADYAEMAKKQQAMATLQEKFQTVIAKLTPLLLPVLDKFHEWADAVLSSDSAFGDLEDSVNEFMDPIKTMVSWIGYVIAHWPAFLAGFVLYKVVTIALTAAISAKAVAERSAALSANLMGNAGMRNLAAMSKSVPVMLAVGAAALMIGLGVGVAAYGIAQMAIAFKDLNAGQMIGVSVALLILGAAMLGFTYMLLTMAPAAAMTYPLILALGAALFLMGAGVGIAALGMAELVKSINPESAAAFGIFSGFLGMFSVAIISLAAALTLMGNPLALMGVWNLGRVFEKIEKSSAKMGPAALALGEILGAVKEVDKYGLGPIETSFKNIRTYINGINLVKLVAMKTLLNTSTKALKAAEAVGFRASAGSSSPTERHGSRRESDRKLPKITIPIELKIDQEKFADAVIEVEGKSGRQVIYGEGT